MGGELDRQNVQMDRLNKKTDVNIGHLGQANQRIRKQLWEVLAHHDLHKLEWVDAIFTCHVCYVSVILIWAVHNYYNTGLPTLFYC